MAVMVDRDAADAVIGEALIRLMARQQGAKPPTDPVAFARQSLGFTPDPWQERVLTWTGQRLLLNVSRQAGKSTISAVLALYEALYSAGSLTLLISPSLRQSSELFRKVKDMAGALKTPLALEEDNKLSMQLMNSSRVISLPSSEATIRGFGGVTLIIEDEASRVPDELYAAIRPMLAIRNGRLMLMSTPWGKRGHFFKEWTEGGERWERIQVAAEECPRIDSAFLADELASLGPQMFRQEYGCSFEETTDSVFTFEFVQSLHDEAIQPLFGGVAG